MSFYIQVSNPTFLRPNESYDDSFKEVIEAIFPYEAEYAFLVWHGLPIPLRYKYDIGMIFNEVLSLLSLLLSKEEIPGFPFTLSCFAFTASWYVRCTSDSLKIESEWGKVTGEYEDWLNKHSQLEIKKSVFMAEWKMLLRKVIEAIEQSDLKVEKKELRKLYKIEAAITKFGELYSEFPLDDNPGISRVEDI
jgi:hypothetical protein